MPEHLSDHPDVPPVPIVSDGVARAVSGDLARDPDFKERLFHDMNEEQHALITELLIEANRQADDDIAKKEAFVQGAVFALAALRRQRMSDELEKLFQAEQQEVSLGPDAA